MLRPPRERSLDTPTKSPGNRSRPTRPRREAKPGAIPGAVPRSHGLGLDKTFHYTHADLTCRILTESGVDAASFSGGTGAWAADDRALHHPQGATSATSGMERQVRFAACTIVLVGLLLGLLVHPAFQILSAGIAAGLVFSALSNTCGMAAMLPHNRPHAAALDNTLSQLRNR
ncbi:hypothetical protein GCM10009646_34890 [Streptomyces aureus]